MQASRANPQLRYFSQPKPSSRDKAWRRLQTALKTNTGLVKQLPDHLQEHRKYVMLDYRKKIEEIKQLKERFSTPQKSQRNSRNLRRSFRVQTQRPSIARSLSPQQQVLIKVQSERRRKTQLSRMFNTINICSQMSKSCLQQSQEDPQSKNPHLSAFQKGVLKRLKTRENMIIKKKIDSFHHDTRFTLVMNQLGMRLDSQKSQSFSKWMCP